MQCTQLHYSSTWEIFLFLDSDIKVEPLIFSDQFSILLFIIDPNKD